MATKAMPTYNTHLKNASDDSMIQCSFFTSPYSWPEKFQDLTHGSLEPSSLLSPAVGEPVALFFSSGFIPTKFVKGLRRKTLVSIGLYSELDNVSTGIRKRLLNECR
jgi:hypothetical protein